MRPRTEHYEGRQLEGVRETLEIEKRTTMVKSAAFGSQAYLMILKTGTGNDRDVYQADAC
jgi:hypothetical protein